MALKGLDIFKLSPKTNCKQCGSPTCMAFCMKVAQGAVPIDKCPHFSADAIAKLSEATAPPMKTLQLGEYKLGGETVLYRHDKTFVSRPLYGAYICDCMDDIDARIEKIPAVDYDRIGERMHCEVVCVNHNPNKSAEDFLAVVNKVAALDRAIVLNVKDAAIAEQALAAVAGKAVILNAADENNYEEMSKIATAAGAILGVSASSLEVLHDVIEKLEALGNKNLILDVGTESIKSAFANAVKIRRACLAKNPDRVFGYPSLVNAARLAPGDSHMQCALASLFTARYGSIVIMDEVDYAKGLALFGLRQNIYTDPQKPMRVTPGNYKLNGADENSICLTTVDFALTYFVVSGEVERSGVPVNLLISDAGGYSVLTSWAAGKFSAGTISKFLAENPDVAEIKNRTLVIPGKVAVLKGELEAKLPDWKIVVAPREAVELVKFLKEYQA